MYDFKHQNSLDIYGSYTKTIEKEDMLNKVRNTLFYILILLFVFIAGLFLFTAYKEDTSTKTFNKPIQINNEFSHLQLTKAITQSVVRNLQSQRMIQQINDDELKIIIQKVINKIETEPIESQYSQK